MSRALYEREVVRRILELREDLMRHDENLAALELLNRCVPYFLHGHPDIEAARIRTQKQVGHMRDPDAYLAYYRANVHERPCEEQFGLTVEQAARIPRVGFLRNELAAMHAGRPLRLLDMAGNDGFMAANLDSLPFPVRCDVVDLHPGNCALARERQERHESIATVAERDAIEYAESAPMPFDAVVAFEVIEHVPDPVHLLWSMERACRQGGRLFVSTPEGTDHGGNLPGWDAIEPKGHVRVYVEETFREVCEEFGTVGIAKGADGVMVAVIDPGG